MLDFKFYAAGGKMLYRACNFVIELDKNPDTSGQLKTNKCNIPVLRAIQLNVSDFSFSPRKIGILAICLPRQILAPATWGSIFEGYKRRWQT